MTRDERRLRFGEFEADLHARELSKQGVRVRLQEQPFQILALLLAEPGVVVTREEFRVRLWPEGTFVDFEHSLNAGIKRLRLALGDTAENPRFIETVPRRGYRFVAPVDAAGQPKGASRPAAGARDGRAERPRLAVLPIANLSDVEQDYFTDGLTDELIAQVGRRCGARIAVLALYSSSVYRDLIPPGRHETLQVDYLVEGSVRREGDRVRITVRLIETASGVQMWADTYDRRLEDCLAVQAEVVARIAEALALELLPAQAEPAVRPPAAYQAFLRGRYYWNKAGSEGLVEAIRYYDLALELDADFSKAYSARARAEVARCEYYLVEPAAVMERIRGDADRALELDPTDSDALVSLAEYHRLRWDWPGAERMYKAALEANPNSESTHRYYALFLAARNRREACRIVDRGWDLDPLCLVNNTAAASVRFFAGDHDGAVARCRETLEIDPTFGPARRRMAAALAELGRFGEAIEEYSLVAPSRLDAITRAWLGHTLAVSGNRKAAMVLAASLEASADGQVVPPYHLAMLYAGLEERHTAFQLLERACEARDPWLSTIEVEPRFKSLRDDERYDRLLEQLKLIDAANVTIS